MNTTTQPSHAAVYNIPERSQARAPKLPLLRYTEDSPTVNVLDTDERYCLSGYGDISVSEHYDVVKTGEDEKHLRVPRLRHVRPRAPYQRVRPVSNHVGKSSSSDPKEPLLTSNTQQFEPEYFRNVIKTTSKNPPDSPNTDFREFFENLLRKPPPTRRRKRSLILPISFGSEAVDAHPRSK